MKKNKLNLHVKDVDKKLIKFINLNNYYNYHLFYL